MSNHVYAILPEQAQEDALHANRLLHVEERPFERVRKRLLGPDALIRWAPPKQLPSPPPDVQSADSATADADGNDEKEQARRDKYREDILLDFAAVESSILRIQLIQASNARERQRYAMEKAKILETAQAVKNNTLELRTQLVEAQRLLQLRKGYDELAAKLIDPKKLKPRFETQEDIEKLEKEIEDLQQESADYETVWTVRREVFDRVVSEGENMIKVIKGIKDEPEPDADKEDRMDDADEGGRSAKHERSRIGSPAPESGRTPMLGGETPVPESAAPTPRPHGDENGGMQQNSLAATPLSQAQQDVDMLEGHQPPAPISMEIDGEEGGRATPAEAISELEVNPNQHSTPAANMSGDGGSETPEGRAAAMSEEMDET